MTDPVRFSLIIPMHNDRATLQRCLEALNASTRRPDQLLVADDGSTDGSDELARSFGAEVIRIEGGPLGPAAARNRAAARASGEVLVFLDSDVEVRPETFERLLRPLEHDAEVNASFGSYDDLPAAGGVVSRYANLRHHHVHQQGDPEAATFWAGCGAVRRAAFEAASGFDETFSRPSIEDIDLGMRLREAGGRIRLVPGAQATHLKIWNLATLWRTDVLRRALPWSRRIMHRRHEGDAAYDQGGATLNTTRSQQVAAIAAHLVWLGLLAGLLIHPLLLIVAGGALLAWLILNRGLLALLARRGGIRGLIGGGLLHWVYYLYSSVTFALVALHWQWASGPLARRVRAAAAPTGGPGCRRSAQGLLVLAIVALAVASGAAFTLGWVETDSLVRLATSMEKDPTEPRFSLQEMTAVQSRALLAGVGYLVVASGLVWLGPRAVRLALRDAALGMRGLRRISPTHWGCLLGFTALAALLAGLHAGQIMRLDESTSFLNYGIRSPIVALGFYQSTNNHMLHSMLMRGAVVLFGKAEWALRLPALVASVACVPATYLAGRRLIGANAGLLAAGLAAGATYTVELATNARGYSLVNLAFLLSLALLPAAGRRRPAAMAGLVLLAGLGAWAVPMMIYPFAICVIWLLIVGLGHPPGIGRMRRLGEVTVMVMVTGLLVLLLYSPSLVVVGFWDQGSREVLDGARQTLDSDLFDPLLTYLRYAWDQWTYPLAGWGKWLTLLLAGAGWLVLLGRGVQARALALAMVLGPLGVLAATQFAAPPWWSLAFGFPLYMLLLAVPLAAVGQRRDERATPPWRDPLLAVALAGSTATLTLGATYPRGFPHYMGYRDAPAAAAYLDAQDLSRAEIVTGNLMRTPLNYYLYRRGRRPHLIAPERQPAFVPERVYAVTRNPDKINDNIIDLRQQYRLRRVNAHRLPDSWVIEYKVNRPASGAATRYER